MSKNDMSFEETIQKLQEVVQELEKGRFKS